MPTNAPSTIDFAASSTPLGMMNAKLFRSFAFRVRTAAPASLRSSAEEKLFALPPPINSKRLAFSPCGLCNSAISSILPVTSPEAMRSAAASCTARSSVWICGLCFSDLSPLLLFSAASVTATTRHSVSICEGIPVLSVVFILRYSILSLKGAPSPRDASGPFNSLSSWAAPTSSH